MTLIKIENKDFVINGKWLRIISLRDDLIDDIGNPEVIVDTCYRNHLPADILTFSQNMPDLEPKFDYFMEWDNIAAVPVTTYAYWLLKQIHPNTRNKIKKAKKSGVEVKTEGMTRKLAEGMVEIFNETPVRRGKRYSYYGRDPASVEKEWSKDLDRSNFIVAYYNKEIIGFIQLVYCERCARTSGTVAKIAHRNIAPMNALIAKAVEICAEKRIPYLIYGKYSYGEKTEDSLTAFKKNNGFEKIEIPRYYIPLTYCGKIGFHLGLHHRISSIIPNWGLNKLKNIRHMWYRILR